MKTTLFIFLVSFLLGTPLIAQTAPAIDFLMVDGFCQSRSFCKEKNGVRSPNREGDAYCIVNTHPSRSISFEISQKVEVFENGKLTSTDDNGGGYWNSVPANGKFVLGCKHEELIFEGNRYFTRYHRPEILRAHFMD